MEYLDNKHHKIDDSSNLQLDKLTADGKLTKVRSKDQMTSFKLYVSDPNKKKKTTKKSKPKSKPRSKKEIEDIIDSKIAAGNKQEDAPVKKKKKKSMDIVIPWVSLTDKMLFMDNLSTMLRAGLALAPALKTLKKEMKNAYFRQIMEYLQQHVENGQLLSKGMKKYPKVFTEMVIATVEVGENTGMLADSFGHLADILKAEKELKSKVTSALMYPIIVLLALIAVSLFLALFIFPQLVGLFESANVKLPFVLVAVQTTNFFIRAYGWYLLGGLIGLGFLLRMIFSHPNPKLKLHTLLLKIPFVGKLISEMALTSFAGNLHALLSAGLSIVKSMEIVSQTISNLKYRQAVLEMSKELEKGYSLEKSMSKRPHLFPSLTIQLCQVGETTGTLEDILAKITKFYEDRVNNILANLSTIIEPLLLVIVGVAVGFIAISVISPMYELTSSFAN